MIPTEFLGHTESKPVGNACMAIADAIQDFTPSQQANAIVASFLMLLEAQPHISRSTFLQTATNMMKHGERYRAEFRGAADYYKNEM